MSLEFRFRTAMLADSGVTALIGRRLFWTQKPQSTTQAGVKYPCVAYQRISTQRLYTQESLEDRSGSSGWARFQLTIWADGADGADTADTVADALIAALKTFNLMAQPESPAVLRQAPNFVLQQRSSIEPQTPQPIAKQILDVKVWFQDLS